MVILMVFGKSCGGGASGEGGKRRDGAEERSGAGGGERGERKGGGKGAGIMLVNIKAKLSRSTEGRRGAEGQT